MTSIAVKDVVFRDDTYPRLKTDPITVQKYAEDLTVLPPIEINQHNELIDGWHRWTAHRKMDAENILCRVTATKSDAELLELAIARNASHGLQLSQEDKKNMAMKLYHMTPEKERTEKKKELEKILSVSERTITRWTSRIDKDAKERRDQRIFDDWLACSTEGEIAKEENVTQQTVNEVVSQISATLPKSGKVLSDFSDADFQVPIYNVWKQQEKTSGSSHFGNSESRWLENLLYLYTNPFDIVIDPFAGGGSTIREEG